MHELNPRAKALIAALGITAALITHRPLAALGFLAIYVVPVVYLADAGGKAISLATRLLLPTYLMLLFVYGVLVPCPPGADQSKIAGLLICTDGLAQASEIGIRLAALMGIVVSYANVTSPREMADGLRGLGIPTSIAGAFVASFGLARDVRRRIVVISDAQRSRGLHTSGHIIRRFRAIIPLLRPLVFAMMMSAVERAPVWSHRGLLHPVMRSRTPFAFGDWCAVFVSFAALATMGVLRWGY